MKEIYEIERIRKQIRQKRESAFLEKYQRETINSLLGQDLICDEEGDFLIAHLSI